VHTKGNNVVATRRLLGLKILQICICCGPPDFLLNLGWVGDLGGEGKGEGIGKRGQGKRVRGRKGRVEGDEVPYQYLLFFSTPSHDFVTYTNDIILI